ncbi:MAG: phenylacetate--CoA ligase family protein [Pseudomonadota bacterium]
MRAFLKKMMSKAPEPVVELAKVIYDFASPETRYGKPYVDALELLAAGGQWSLDELAAYQDKCLGQLIGHCRARVPYYRELFKKMGIIPSDIEGTTDLGNLPFLTKQIVRDRKHDLMAEDFPYLQQDHEHTSGSTGAPLDFYLDRKTRAMEMALALRVLLWLGYGKGDRVAEFKEDRFVDPKRICRYFPGSRHLKFSFFTVDDERLDRMVKELQRFRPAFIKAFPSSILILARWMERHGRTIPPPKCIITSSENLYPSIREQVERVFRAPVIDYYGQNERVATAFQCSLANGYHVQMEEAVVEMIPSRGEQCEIVGTSLISFGMPFIRYRTGDLAVPGAEPCPCGKSHPLISRIVGRECDVIITPEGNIVAPVAMDYAFCHLDEIREAQIIQESVDTLRVKIVAWDALSESTRTRLRREIDSYLQSPAMKVYWEEVDEIPRTNGGKRPFVVSKINMDDFL